MLHSLLSPYLSIYANEQCNFKFEEDQIGVRSHKFFNPERQKQTGTEFPQADVAFGFYFEIRKGYGDIEHTSPVNPQSSNLGDRTDRPQPQGWHWKPFEVQVQRHCRFTSLWGQRRHEGGGQSLRGDSSQLTLRTPLLRGGLHFGGEPRCLPSKEASQSVSLCVWPHKMAFLSMLNCVRFPPPHPTPDSPAQTSWKRRPLKRSIRGNK